MKAILVAALVPCAALAFPGMEKDPAKGPAAAPAPALPPGHPDIPSSSPADLGKEKGTVRIAVRRPDGSPAAALEVALVVTLEGAVKARFTARTDTRGIALFRDVPRHSLAGYTAVAPWQGVNYYARPEFAKGKREAEAAMKLATTTKDRGKIRIRRAHIVVDPAREGIRVTELLVLKNEGSATYAGDPLPIPIFHGATSVRGEGGSFAFEGHELRYGGYVRPGDTQVQFEYQMPLTGSFERKTVLPIERLFVILTRASFRLSGAVFESVKEMTRGDVKFLAAQGGPIAAGGSFAFEIAPPAGMMAGVAGAGGEGPKGELVRDWRVVAKWMAPLFAVLIFFVAVYLASRREEDDLALADDAALLAQRDRWLADLAKAIRESSSGSKAAARRAADLTRRLADLYRNLDERAAKRALQVEKRAP
jgi:hypothetical protein